MIKFVFLKIDPFLFERTINGTENQRWARSGFARQYQYQHFCKGQMHDNTNIKIETTPILLANINIKNVDFDYAFKFNINI